MAKKRVTLVTCAQYPELSEDEAGLVDELNSRGVDARIAIWNDPHVDWEEAGVCVIRTVRDYASHREEFVQWAHQVPRLLNPADVTEWATDKHYLLNLQEQGVPVIPTTWLEPEQHLSKHQVHTRFPAYGEFVVKPAVSSGGREMGRYDANNGMARMAAVTHANRLLQEGRSVMVQRYLSEVDEHGEYSLVYMNGVLSHSVEKAAMLTNPNTTEVQAQETVTGNRQPNSEEWIFGEKVRSAIHRMIKQRLGHDQQLLFLRIDIVPDGKGSYYLMEVSPVDGSLYLRTREDGIGTFADAICNRVFW